MQNKKELAIVFGATGNMAFALGNVLIGLKKHSPGILADIIIFEQNLEENDKNVINSIISSQFKKYEFPKKNVLTEGTLKKFSELTFSRFECFNLLSEYKKVLWLDIDILIQKDITPLLNEVSTGISLIGGLNAGDDFEIEIKGLEKGKENFNAGIMLLQDNLQDHPKLANWCYDKTLELAQYLRCADQGIINLMIKEHNLEVHKLDWKYNFNPAYGGKTDLAVILHTFCPEKFWNYWSYSEWNNNYKIWIKFGGSPYTGKKYNWWNKKFKNVPNPLRNTRSFIKFVLKIK